MNFYYYPENESRSSRFGKNRFLIYFAASVILAALSGLGAPSTILGMASAVFLCAALLSQKKIKAASSTLTVISALLLSLALCGAGGYAMGMFKGTKIISSIISSSAVLYPFFASIPLSVCLLKKKDPVTTAVTTIICVAVFTAVQNCATVFYTYNEIGMGAFNSFFKDMSALLTETYQSAKITGIQITSYVSFMVRMVASLLPGMCILFSTVQVFVIIAVLKFVLRDSFEKFHKGPWAISLNVISAVINAICIPIFLSCFYSESVTAFSAAAGNFVLIFAPASSIIGIAYLLKNMRQGGFFRLIMFALPLIMLFISPVSAIFYLSFVGSFTVIIAKVARHFAERE